MGKRIAVVGVGALGGYVGGWLAHTGEDVTLIDFWPENIETIRRNGLELDGVTPEEKITVKNAKTMHLTEMEALSRQKPIDIAFVSMNTGQATWNEVRAGSIVGLIAAGIAFLMGTTSDHLFDLVTDLANATGINDPVRSSALSMFESRTTLSIGVL